MSRPKTLATQLLEGPSPRLELECAELRVQGGPDRGLVRKLEHGVLLIGSSPSADLMLRDGTVSARHAEITLDERGCRIRDLGSTNGVLCGQIALERAYLCDGMRLELGDTTILVRSLKKSESIGLSRAGGVAGVVAHSVKMRALLFELEQLASASTTVLLEGETGCGKERVAEALHALGPRRNAPFVVFDCSAVAASLIASELFGHERGAFTGADTTRSGIFREAEGGTLFLDEVGELPLELQPMLLRALEQRTTRAVGGKSDRRHDVRVVAASNRNLAAEVRAGRFREDLFYRLAVARVRIPPLRARREDITPLAEAFAAELGIVLDAHLRAAFEAYEWPGNVRELRNTIARIAATPGRAVELGMAEVAHELTDAPFVSPDGRFVPLPEMRRRTIEDFERNYIAAALRRAQGSLTKAAELTGVSRQAISVLAEKVGLHKRTPR